MKMTLEERGLEHFVFLEDKYNLFLHPSNGLPAPPRHPSVWCKGPVSTHCSLYFNSLSALVTAHERVSGFPRLPSGQATVPWNFTLHCFFTCSFSPVSLPVLSQQYRDTSVWFSVLACWENYTPALRRGHLQPRRKVGCQHLTHGVIQRLPHHVGGQEALKAHDILPFGQLYLPDSHCKLHKDQQISSECLISIFSDARTALSTISGFFFIQHHVLSTSNMKTKLYHWLIKCNTKYLSTAGL